MKYCKVYVDVIAVVLLGKWQVVYYGVLLFVCDVCVSGGDTRSTNSASSTRPSSTNNHLPFRNNSTFKHLLTKRFLHLSTTYIFVTVNKVTGLHQLRLNHEQVKL